MEDFWTIPDQDSLKSTRSSIKSRKSTSSWEDAAKHYRYNLHSRLNTTFKRRGSNNRPTFSSVGWILDEEEGHNDPQEPNPVCTSSSDLGNTLDKQGEEDYIYAYPCKSVLAPLWPSDSYQENKHGDKCDNKYDDRCGDEYNDKFDDYKAEGDTDSDTTLSRSCASQPKTTDVIIKVKLPACSRRIEYGSLYPGVKVIGGIIDKAGLIVTYVTHVDQTTTFNIREGDQIIEINGEAIIGMSHEQLALFLLRDVQHRDVDVTIRRSDHCLEHYLEISNVLSQKRNKVPREKREGCMAVYCSKEEQQKKYTNAAIDISRPTQQLSLSIDSLWSPSLDKLKKEWRNQANSIEISLKYMESSDALSVTLVQGRTPLPTPQDKSRGKHQILINSFLVPHPQTGSQVRASKLVLAAPGGVVTWNQPLPHYHLSPEELFDTDIQFVVWEYKDVENYTFIGEILLSLSDTQLVDLTGQPHWYPLGDHNPNLGPIPQPTLYRRNGATLLLNRIRTSIKKSLSTPDTSQAFDNHFNLRTASESCILEETNQSNEEETTQSNEEETTQSNEEEITQSIEEDIIQSNDDTQSGEKETAQLQKDPAILPDSKVSIDQRRRHNSVSVLLNPDPTRKPQGGMPIFGGSIQKRSNSSVSKSSLEAELTLNEEAQELSDSSGNQLYSTVNSRPRSFGSESSDSVFLSDAASDSVSDKTPCVHEENKTVLQVNGSETLPLRYQRSASVGNILTADYTTTAQLDKQRERKQTVRFHSSVEDLTSNFNSREEETYVLVRNETINIFSNFLRRISAHYSNTDLRFSDVKMGPSQFLPSTTPSPLLLCGEAELSLRYSPSSSTVEVIFHQIRKSSGKLFYGDCQTRLLVFEFGNLKTKRQVPLKFSKLTARQTGWRSVHTKADTNNQIQLQMKLQSSWFYKTVTSDIWLDVKKLVNSAELKGWYTLLKSKTTFK